MPRPRSPKPKPPEPEKNCEVCGEPVKEAYELFGCDGCGRLFGPCCNNCENPDLCIKCVEKGVTL